MTDNNPCANPSSKGCADPADDAFKHTVAVAIQFLKEAVDQVDRMDAPEWQRATTTALLQNLGQGVLAAAMAKLPEPQWFSGGWPVVNRVDLGMDCSCVHWQVWHPDRDHGVNRPQELPSVECPAGGRHRLFVMGPGDIEVRTEGATR